MSFDVWDFFMLFRLYFYRFNAHRFDIVMC